jgi:hypothetical protein
MVLVRLKGSLQENIGVRVLQSADLIEAGIRL